MKRNVVVLLLMLGLALSARVNAGESVRIGGTGTGTLLVERLIDTYTKAHPDIQVTTILPPMGSNGGLRALDAGSIQIAIVTFASAYPETSAGSMQRNTVPWVRTPFVFTGKEITGGTPMTLKQVAGIYSGRVAQWPDGRAVRLVTRTERETDTRLLRAISTEMNESISLALKRLGMPFAENDLDNQQLLERTPGSFGAIAFGQLLLTNSPLKPAKLDGVVPSADNLLIGSYRLEKQLQLVTGKEPSTATRSFIEYLQSPAVMQAIRQYGFIPAKR